ncbi:MAG: SDR family oxidoreductase [Pontibacterium sp.]
MIAITGATGQLGQLVINELVTKVDPSQLIAVVRSPEKAQSYSEQGIDVRLGDYSQADTLTTALAGVKQLLLISSSEVGQRTPQHKAVIEAAKANGVEHILYTSILKADSSPLPLAKEHLETEALIKASGIAYTVLRNGWYTENYAASIAPSLEHSAFIGCAGEGQIASAARADYAAAAVAAILNVLEGKASGSDILELAGGDAYTLSEFAAEIAQQAGKTVAYVNLPESEFAGALIGAGLPEPLAVLLAESDTGASKGGLFSDDATLSSLIGRPTTPYADVIKATLAAL